MLYVFYYIYYNVKLKWLQYIVFVLTGNETTNIMDIEKY